MRKALLPGMAALVAVAMMGCPTPPPQLNITYLYASQYGSHQGVRTFDMWERAQDTTCGGGHPGEPDDLPTGGDDVLVGFRTWLNPNTKCSNSVIRSYRGYVLFDVSSLRPNANLYAGQATLDFDLMNSSTPTSTNSATCAVFLAGVIQAWQPDALNPFEMDFALPNHTPFWQTGSPPPQITLPGAIPATATQIGPVRVNPAGNLAGHFSIDVNPFVKGWLGTTPNWGFAFISDFETFVPFPPNVVNSCIANYDNFMLRVYTY